MPTANELPLSELAMMDQPIDSPEERCEPRYPAKAGVVVNVQATPDIVTEDATVADISFRGLGLLLDSYMEPGTHVIVHMGTQRLETEVRHCTREEQRYRVGIMVHRATEKQAAKSRRDWAGLLGGSRRQVQVA